MTKILGVELVSSTVDSTPIGQSNAAPIAATNLSASAIYSASVVQAATITATSPGSVLNQTSFTNLLQDGVRFSPASDALTPGLIYGTNAENNTVLWSVDNQGNAEFTSLSAAVINGTPNLKSSPGYDTLLNGFLVQGGSVSSMGGNDTNVVTVSFPKPFPNACIAVVVSTLGGTDRITFVESFNTLSATLANNGSGVGATWIAFGY